MIYQDREISIRAARNLQTILGLSTGFTAGAALMGSWVANQFEPALPLSIILVITVAWSTVCNQARSFVRGRFLRTDYMSIGYIVLAAAGSGRWLVFAGILIGLSIYVFAAITAFSHLKLTLKSGDRFYHLRYPMDFILPLNYLAPEPLSPALEPSAALYTSPGFFGFPTWRISIFDPASLHAYLVSRSVTLSSQDLEWDSVISRFRRAVRMLGLLEALGRLETSNLDGVALAAAARLAIANMPNTAKLTLIEALPSFTAGRRRVILDAFDLIPATL